MYQHNSCQHTSIELAETIDMFDCADVSLETLATALDCTDDSEAWEASFFYTEGVKYCTLDCTISLTMRGALGEVAVLSWRGEYTNSSIIHNNKIRAQILKSY